MKIGHLIAARLVKEADDDLAIGAPGAAKLLVSGLEELQKQNGVSPATLELIVPGAKVSRADIASMPPPIFAMPPMATILSANDIRDVIAWLSEQKREPRKKRH